MLLSAAGCLRRFKGSIAAPAKAITFILVSAGQDHTCGLTAEGEVYCWGSNRDGQLGSGAADTAVHPRPLRVATDIRFRFVTAGYRHTCALTANGAAYCWGANDSGQLGDGSIERSATPMPVSGKLIFESLSAGATHTCGVTTSGEGYCWGGNWHGQLGNGSMDGEQKYPCCHTAPTRIVGAFSFSRVTAGGIHTCGLTSSGKAYCWGIANYGRLGVGRTNAANVPTPTAVSGSLEFLSINQGGFYTCGLAKTKVAYCWGAGSDGQLGIGSAVAEQDVPAVVSGNFPFVIIAPGDNHTCGITADGTVYCWGSNRFGEIGDGSTENRYAPVRMLSERKFKLITAGGNDFSGHTCGITTDGKTLCWGDNRWGQIGNGLTAGSLRPALVVERAR
ncbi:MAG: hypothetical protein ABJC05_05930 [Pyrinomonadaceae bacterium]